MKSETKYYSPGKLLLTGEYLVMKGAQALAIPLKFGQEMSVFQKTGNGSVQWKSTSQNEKWFQVDLDLKEFKVINSTNHEIAERLKKAFQYIEKTNPGSISKQFNYKIETNLSFNKSWGLGSSSTFVNNLAKWGQVDAFCLNQHLFGGSGYDIACVNQQSPILYQIKDKIWYDKININWNFKNDIHFIYLGNKMNTRKGIHYFLNHSQFSKKDVETVNKITKEIVTVSDKGRFIELIKNHEQLIAELTQQEKVKDLFFSDFDGEVKSLGAWGGDFIMAIAKNKHSDIDQYFINKGYSTVFRWNDIVL